MVLYRSPLLPYPQAIVLASRAGGFANVNAMDGVRGEAAKRHIFSILDTKSAIDPLAAPSEGDRAPTVSGKLEFRNVHFSYPSRPTTGNQFSTPRFYQEPVTT